MRPDEYAAYDGMGLAELIRSGQVTAAEVHEAAYDALQAVQPELNAVVEGPWREPLDYDSNGPLAGVPFVIKDILLHAAGVPTHFGSRLLAAGIVHDHDTVLMGRFRAAGLATMATTSTPEFALNGSTEPLLGGITRNPWDLNRTPGGSSGGTAALVAAGAVPLGHANDGAGSIRIPASFTGLVGLKPTRGRVPIGPDMQEAMYGLATELAVTRTVRDTAAILDAVCGFTAGEKFSMPAPEHTFTSQVGADAGRLRIAVLLDSWTEQRTHPGVAAAVQGIADALVELGHQVEFAAPQVEWMELQRALGTAWSAGTASAVYPVAEALGITLDENVLERTTLTLAEHGRTLTPIDLGAVLAAFTVISQQMGAFMSDWDLWLAPTTTVPAPPVGHFDANCDATPQQWVQRCLESFPYLAVSNVTGMPAISLPAGLVDGLPVGAHLTAQLGREDRLIRVAAQLEQARPWADLRPNMNVAGAR